MSGSESEDNDDHWFLNLHEFVESLQPQLKELEALTQVEEFITNLESTDPSFHRYNFVAQIKDRLDTELSPIIDELLSKKTKKEEDTLAPNISEDLLKSHEFEQSSSSIVNAIQSASESITSHLNSNTFDFSGAFQKHDRPNNHFKASSSVCSTTDGMEFMFMPPDRYKSLAKEIDPAKSVEQRLKALGILQQVPQTDLVASDAWELTRIGLHKALNDEKEEISSRALKFISRLFVSGSSHVIREYFLLLVENLTEYFLDSTSHMVYLESGLDLGDRRNILLLKKFRLLNDIQKQLPSTWLRYSEKYVEEMIESLVNLLGISTPKITSSRDSTIMNPLHFLALVDPHAVWFKQWMHGYYSRSHLLNSISNHTSFLKRPIKSCIEVCKRLHKMDSGLDLEELKSKNKIDITFESCDILYLHFIHSTNFLSRLMLYKNGREALFFELNNGKILNIDMVVLALFDIMKLYPFPVNKSAFHGGHLAAECFKLLSNSDEETVQSCLCFDSLYQSVIQAFQQKCMSLPLVIEMLAEIAISSEGCFQLLVERDLSGYDEPLPVLEVIGETFIMSEIDDDVKNSTLLPLMTLLQRVFKNFDALILLSKYSVEKFLSDILKKQKVETNVLLEKVKSSMSQGLPSSPQAHPPGSGSGSARKMAENIAYKKSVQIEKQVMETILRLALTPKGVELILQCDVFEHCVAYFHNRLLEKGRTARNGYGIVMSQISSTSKGIEALLKCGYVDYMLNEIWFYLEGFTNDYTITALDDIPQDFSDIFSQKLFLSLYELVPNVHSVRALFHSSLQQPNKPSDLHCFEDFFNRLVLLKLPDTMLLYHPEQTHYFALRFLSYLTTSLDVMIFLQAKYDFQRVLLDLQKDSFYHDRDCFIVDQNSVQRNQILVQTHLLGGPNERKIPPNTLSEDGTYQWPLFSTYPVPPVYSNKGRTSATFSPNSHLTKLKEFLREERDLKEISEDEAKKLLSGLQDMFMVAIKNRLLKEEEETIILLMELYTNLMKIITNTTKQEKMNKKDREEKSSNKKKTITDEEEIAIAMFVRYGVGLRLLESTPEEHEDILRKMLISMKNHFSNEYNIFDWFVSIVFLIFKGDDQKTFHFLIGNSSLPSLPTNWLQFRMKKSEHSRLMTQSCHWLEYIIKNELQQVYAAFQISGVAPSQIYRLWLQQCFLNFLDWSDILTFMTCCILLGSDYQIYFVISLLKHLKDEIMQQAQENNLLVFLRTTPIYGFHVNEQIEYWQELEEKYRERIFSDDF